MTTQHQTQATKTQKREWVEPNQLDIPPEVEAMLKSQGYGARWIRVLLDGKPDAVNVMTRKREGYEFVTLDSVDKFWPDAPVMDYGAHGNLIVIGDLALAKLPLEISDDRKRKMHQKTKELTNAIQRQLMENQPLNQLMPIQDSSKAKVYRGTRPASLDTED